MPYSRKQITSQHYRLIKPMLAPGMAICTRTDGELANLFIPGFWSHAGIYVGDSTVVEAVGKGVVKTDLIDFLLTKDAIIVKDPSFANKEQMKDAAEWALKQVGKPYDMYFDKLNEYFYCSELIWLGFELTMGEVPFTKLKTVWGEETVVPDDIANANKKWKTAYDSRDLNLFTK